MAPRRVARPRRRTAVPDPPSARWTRCSRMRGAVADETRGGGRGRQKLNLQPRGGLPDRGVVEDILEDVQDLMLENI